MKKVLWLLVSLILTFDLLCLYTWVSPGKKAFAMGGGEYTSAAYYLAQLFQCGRLIMVEIVDTINTQGVKIGEPLPEGAPVTYKGLTPAIFGRLMADEFVSRTGIKIKQTTLGKGKGSRNLYNKPDKWEETQLKKLASPSYPKNVGFGEFTRLEGSGPLVYRYILPVYIEKPCLKCHGDPANSPTGDGRDITGHLMEGYKPGELRGGISVTMPIVEEKNIVYMESSTEEEGVATGR
ncbi:MAG TPA: Tll0287-like domain-containing protein [Candidatus Hypogeohydataceae bacterium YC38]